MASVTFSGPRFTVQVVAPTAPATSTTGTAPTSNPYLNVTAGESYTTGVSSTGARTVTVGTGFGAVTAPEGSTLYNQLVYGNPNGPG